MSSKTTRLGLSNAPLPTITPHLMPFHIEHTGSAPLSTYFIVKPVPQQPDTLSLVERLKARFTSAFRGRKMQGLAVSCPDGYSGVVLQTEELGTDKRGKNAAPKKRPLPPKATRQKGRRSTRSSARSNVEDVDEDGDGIVVEGETLEEDSGAMQTLRPTSKFSSFTLWNADVDVDEGRDEYLRALSEYQQLSAEIHRID